MADLPSWSGPEVIRAFEALGFVVARQESSHVMMKRDGHRFLLTVPVHGHQPVKKGTLRGLIRASGHTIDEFVNALN